MTIESEIKELKCKAANYEFLKEQYDELKNEVNVVMRSLIKLTGSTGSTSMKPRVYRKDGKLTELGEKLYEKLKTEDGTQITAVEIESMATEMGIEYNKNTTWRITHFLLGKGDIEKTKDGRNVRLFYRGKIHIEGEELPKIEKTSFMG